jgi:A/G-specific adenine glycosylase
MVPVADGTFSAKLIAWQRRHGRRDLPWQNTRDPYRVWLSEVMLQQTQVGAVIPYYRRFIERFPTVQALAAAEEDEVLRFWSGLGYYARGRNLHAAAKVIASGGFPRTAQAIAQLPGVGRSTAAAVAAFAFGERAAILDGNVKRVLARCFAVEAEKALWTLAESLLPRAEIEAYTQGLMDLGATVCTRTPKCGACPMQDTCIARGEGRIAELPRPRSRKPLPARTWHWLVLRDGNEVLLERRAPTGIWGGLWVFPDVPAGSAVARRCRALLGVDVDVLREMEALQHGFTHFRVTIRPLLCAVKRRTAQAQLPGRLWLGIEEAAAAAVPAPVRTLLGRLGGA